MILLAAKKDALHFWGSSQVKKYRSLCAVLVESSSMGKS
jgi:hypothetical protein